MKSEDFCLNNKKMLFLLVMILPCKYKFFTAVAQEDERGGVRIRVRSCQKRSAVVLEKYRGRIVRGAWS